MIGHYDASDVDAALACLPVRRGDVLFVHSNVGYFGRAAGVCDVDGLCSLFFDALRRRVGDDGTLVVPTFTYSFPRRQAFDPHTSPATEMGALAEWVRRHPAARRSVDPCYSIAAVGRDAAVLTADAPENSFAPTGFFGRFLDRDGVILNLNFDAGSTFLHYLEREHGVPYRFDKTFEGRLCFDGEMRVAHSTIFVRYASSDATEPAFEPFHSVARAAGAFVEVDLGRGRLGCIRARDCARLLDTTLPTRPWLLTRADATGVMPALSPEPTWQPL